MLSVISTNLVTIVTFIIAVAWMLSLAKKDHDSLAADKHVDLKSVIVSIGVLGTFIGIAVGLWKFETTMIDESVPKLLEGLKLAFATSIAGMTISISLSSIQKDKLTGGDDELSILGKINDKLSGLSELNEQVKGLRLEIRDEQKSTRGLIETATESMSKIASEDSIKNFRIEVHEEQLKSRTFLESQFAETNKSLEKAIDVLSRGATEEIIKALETVIQDFNQNLTEQFGDNFKQLNEAIVALLTWQQQFKEIVENDYRMLEQIRESLKGSSEVIETIASRNKEVVSVYEQLSSLINVYDNQVEILNKQLDEFSKIGENASKSFDLLNSRFETVQTSLGEQSEIISKLTSEISLKLPESLGQLESTLVGLTDQFGEDYKSFLENYKKLLP